MESQIAFFLSLSICDFKSILQFIAFKEILKGFITRAHRIQHYCSIIIIAVVILILAPHLFGSPTINLWSSLNIFKKGKSQYSMKCIFM